MLKNLLKKKSEGFTLIEVVIVLAIAGLILVIVFLAVAGAQRSRRDAQRRSDNARMLAQAEQFAASNAGAYPAAWTSASNGGGTFASAFITTANFTNPNGGAYTYAAAAPAGGCTAANIDTVWFITAGRTVTMNMCLEQGVASNTNG